MQQIFPQSIRVGLQHVKFKHIQALKSNAVNIMGKMLF